MAFVRPPKIVGNETNGWELIYWSHGEITRLRLDSKVTNEAIREAARRRKLPERAISIDETSVYEVEEDYRDF